MPIIDSHAHIGDLRAPSNLHRKPISVEDLIRRMDEDRIDKAVLLPWSACPEAVTFPSLFSDTPDIVSQIKAGAKYPNRIILFGNADPRWNYNSSSTDFSWLFERFKEFGCVGLGEVSANIEFHDPRAVNLFRQCGKWNFPVVIESSAPGEGHYGFIDLPGSPYLERLLRQIPETIIIGHGPGFWAEISANVTVADKHGYPSDPIRKPGSLIRLFRTYPNLYADLSAESGYNALSRDESFSAEFLLEFQDRLFFGTDLCFADEPNRNRLLALLERFLIHGNLSQVAFDKITHQNIMKVLNLR